MRGRPRNARMDLLLCRGVVRDSLGSRRRTRGTSAHLAREGGSSRSSWRDRRPRACPRASGGRTRGTEWRAARQTRPYKYEMGCYRPIALRFSYHFTYLSRTFVTCHDSSNEAREKGECGDARWETTRGRRRRGFVVISRESFDSRFDSYFLDFSDAFNSRTFSVYSRRARSLRALASRGANLFSRRESRAARDGARYFTFVSTTRAVNRRL